jgi:hypothetical protein
MLLSLQELDTPAKIIKAIQVSLLLSSSVSLHHRSTFTYRARRIQHSGFIYTGNDSGFSSTREFLDMLLHCSLTRLINTIN